MSTDRDFALALQLQEQYDRDNFKNSNHDKVFSTPVKGLQEHNQTNSNLGSPSWELTDPTPNVYALFVQFNRTFFWGKLSSVAVRWSKRMYSCAGICSYQTRNGFCDIALSEPLLKLRPRKDLVETLLHEMIHAYLFVTNNDRDRNGHGPNFLQHMYRINKKANLNITVYHDFIDEVKLYQTHWWRCNGPCQNQKPYFGMVKRSYNRAPGPSDLWWERHQQMCGGTYIKIREPEKKTKQISKVTKSSKENRTTIGITDFFVPIKDTSGKRNTIHDFAKVDSPKMANQFKKSLNNSSNNVTPVKTHLPSCKNMPNSSDLQPNSIVSKVNLTLNGSETLSRAKNIDNVKETVKNHWAEKYPTTSKRLNDSDCIGSQPAKMIKIENNSKFESKDAVNIYAPSCSNVQYISEINYFPQLSTNFGTDTEDSAETRKSLYYSIPTEMITNCNKILQDIYGTDFTLNTRHFKTCSTDGRKWLKAATIKQIASLQCPLCNLFIPEINIDKHVRECLGEEEFSIDKIVDESSTEVIDLTRIGNNSIKPKASHAYTEVIDLTTFSDNHSGTSVQEESLVLCPICNSSVSNDILSKHVQKCLNDDVEEFSTVSGDTKPKIENIKMAHVSAGDKSENQFQEPVKMKKGEVSPDYCNCPVCDKLIHRNEANAHLEDCVNNTFIGNEDTKIEEDSFMQNNNSSVPTDIDETQQFNESGTKLPCPCCLFMIEEKEMNSHLDQCLL